MIDISSKANAASSNDDFFERACDIVVAFVNNNELKPSEITKVIREVHKTLTELFKDPNAVPNTFTQRTGTDSAGSNISGARPAVAVSDSITPDYIVCLEDGKRLRTLKRYLMGRYGLSPDLYRAKWKLPSDYPMVAPNYSAKRALLAREIGLGHSRKKRKKPGKR